MESTIGSSYWERERKKADKNMLECERKGLLRGESTGRKDKMRGKENELNKERLVRLQIGS